MRAALARRLSRLELWTGGPCSACAGRQPVMLRGEQEIPTCEVCNRVLPAVVLRRDSNFFGNADRLPPEKGQR
jgi:hypothetical protein